MVMIVRADGLMSEHVLPRHAAARPVQAVTSEWLVVTSDHLLGSHLAAVIGRRGGVVRDGGALDAWSPHVPVGRRFVFVDLAAADDGSATGVLRQLARPRVTPRPRLIVRGPDGDGAGELLARRAGAIAYLPGHVAAGFLDWLIDEFVP